MNLKKPLSYEEQVNKLEKQGMYIESKEDAISVLKRVNYYRFTGYAIQNRIHSSSSKYVQGTSFNTIYEIYKFDCEIRIIIRKYIEIVETYFRSIIAYNFSIKHCNSEPYDQHYSEDNFYDKKVYRMVMDGLEKEEEHYQYSPMVKHHIKKYDDKMPMWVIVELLSFSKLSMLYKAMYDSDQDIIAATVNSGRTVVEKHLHCLSVLRNRCAHAARLYNMSLNPPVRLSNSFMKKHKTVNNNSLFAYLVVLMKRLPSVSERAELYNDIVFVIKKYEKFIEKGLIGFPNNYEEILEEVKNNG